MKETEGSTTATLSPQGQTLAEAAPFQPWIFIVDDELLIGEVVETILRLEGFKASFHSDPRLALRAIEREGDRPSLLLTDYAMIPMNGMELIQKCKAALPELRTILFSGNVGEEVARNYLIKPDGFLAKPFLPKALIRLVQSVLASQ